jgi:hypothetical protein
VYIASLSQRKYKREDSGNFKKLFKIFSMYLNLIKEVPTNSLDLLGAPSQGRTLQYIRVRSPTDIILRTIRNVPCFLELALAAADPARWHPSARSKTPRGAGGSRCEECKGCERTPALQAGRYTILGAGVDRNIQDLLQPNAVGALRWVAKARYTPGARRDQACIIKCLKSSGTLSSDGFFALDIRTRSKALEFVDQFNMPL